MTISRRERRFCCILDPSGFLQPTPRAGISTRHFVLSEPPAAAVEAPAVATAEPVKGEVDATEINAEPVVIGGLLP